MAKKQTRKHQGNKSFHKKSNSLNKHVIFGVGFLLTLLLVGYSAYSFLHEDLGPQLPPPPSTALYKQASQPYEARVADLLTYMTLEEKIGQMALVDKNSLGSLEDISKYNLGGILSGAGAKPIINTPQGWLDMTSSMKNQATRSRLGIPILYGVDANHGHANVLGATVFPHAIGLGAARDPILVEEIAAITSTELAATGINWSYSPSLDAPKDIRWGRTYEAFSDDPNLIGELGKSYISGTQNASSDGSYIMATAKHYFGTGAMVWGQSNHKDFKIDQGKIITDDEALTDEYLIPYKNAINANVSSVMVGLTQWGDTRIIDSKYLLNDMLKKELGFKGFIVSDWYGVYEYSNVDDYSSNINTINAGLDMAMLPYDYKSFLKDVRKAVNKGEISQSRIDDAVSRILLQKFKAGLFDDQLNIPELEVVGSAEHRLLARKAVASSAVLLKNESSILPLPKDIGRVLVAGSGANNIGRQSGAWTIEWQGVDGNWMPGGTSILEGMRQVVGDASTIEYNIDGNFIDKNIAKVGIAIVSEKPYAEGWGDNANPAIDTADLAAIEKLKQSSEKVIVVILSGRPLIITDKISSWNAAVAAWLPGSEGTGVADVLFGNYSFTGKLPLPWPASTEQLPIKTDGTTADNSEVLFKRYFGL